MTQTQESTKAGAGGYCPDPNCPSCNLHRKVNAGQRPTAADILGVIFPPPRKPAEAPKPAPAEPAKQAVPSSDSPGTGIPSDELFRTLNYLNGRSRSLRDEADAIESLATTLPGLTDAAKHGVALLCGTNDIRSPF